MIYGELIAILVCMIGAAFFAGIETGVISIHRIRLRTLVEKGVKQTAILQNFLDRPDRLLGTTLVGVNFCMVVSSVLATSLGSHAFGYRGEIAAGILMTVLILIFSEYIPKAWFQSNPIERCRPFATSLWISSLVLQPLALAITRLTNIFLPASLSQAEDQRPLVTRDEITLLAKESEDRGMLSPRQRIMIHRVVDLAGKMAEQIMVPRSRMVVIESTQSAADFLKVSRETNYTRIPVWDPGSKQFTGIVNLFDILVAGQSVHHQPVSTFMRPIQFIVASMPLTEIFPRLRTSRQPMGLVVNAQNEVIGLLTTEDILNRVVGTL